jgi:hypothetical protein
MNRLAYPLAILATCAAFHAQAGDNPSPALLAKIQLAMQAYQAQAAGREFKDMTKFARENEPAQHGVNGGVSPKKVGALDVSKINHGPRTPAAIGQAIGSRANDGDED